MEENKIDKIFGDEIQEIDLSLLEEMEEIITPDNGGSSGCCNDCTW